MQLSNRLLAIAKMVTTGSRLADVGTDHGYIPIYLIQQRKIPSAIAMDINAGPLQRATEHIQENGLWEYIHTRLSDGVKALNQGEADTLVIAGMGGILIEKILKEGQEVLKSVSEFILQPQSDLCRVRRFLCQQGYRIVAEDMIFEDGKYYSMMKAVHGSMHYEEEVFYYFGKELLLSQHPVLKLFLKREAGVCQEVLLHLNHSNTAKAKERAVQIEQEMQLIHTALKYYEV